MVKEKREIIHRFAEILIDTGDRKKALLLLEESEKLSSTIDTDRLRIEYLYLKGACQGSHEGIKAIETAMKLNEKYQSLRLKYKGFKILGDIYFLAKDRRLSAVYYLKTLDVL
jgi:hypothetical protein